MNSLGSAIPRRAARISTILDSVKGSSCKTVTAASGETEFKRLRSFTSQPVRRAARQAEAGPPQCIEASSDLVERRAHVRRPGSDFIETIDEERLPAPFLDGCSGRAR